MTSVGLLDYIIMSTLVMACFLRDAHMSNALECTTTVLTIRMQRPCVCAMHDILGKLVLIHAATKGGWLAHFFASHTTPDKPHYSPSVL